jgi:hypothetical protein
LIPSQFGQFAFCTLFTFDLLLGEFPVRFRPSPGFSRGSFGGGNDCFAKEFEISVSFPGILFLSPNFDELGQHKNCGEYFGSRLIIADYVIFVGNAPQILVTRTKESGVKMISLRFRCKHRHLIRGYCSQSCL